MGMFELGLAHPHENKDTNTEAPDSQQAIDGTKDDAGAAGAFLGFGWL